MASLSVIIPVYNTERYLSQCLDSVLAQRFWNLEVICVDDGSTDGSPQILAKYAARDSRVRVIRQENAGLVAARKTGVMAATGKYVGYVDSDDWIEPEMYETLCSIADRHHTDLVCSGYVLEKGTKIEFYDGFQEGLYQGKRLEALREQLFFCEKDKEVGIRPSLCNKLFRTTMLRKAQMAMPDAVENCEDRICTVACVLEAESVYIVRKAFYHYTFHGDSMSRKTDLYYLDNISLVYRTLCSMYQHPNFSDKMRTQCELYIVKMVLTGMNEYMGFSIPDLLRVNPNWIEKFPSGSKILLYGAGRLGKIYCRQIVSDHKQRLHLSGWVDRNFQNLTGYPQEIQPLEFIKTADYDYILLAFLDKQPAVEVQEQLINEFGVDPGKIVWLEQQEIFWEYAQAAGLLKGDSDYGN